MLLVVVVFLYALVAMEQLDMVVAACVTAGTGIELRPLAGAGGWRTIGLAWRPNAPRAAEYRSLVPLLTETCRDILASPKAPARAE